MFDERFALTENYENLLYRRAFETKRRRRKIDRSSGVEPCERRDILNYATLNYAACHGLHGNFHPCDPLLSSEHPAVKKRGRA